MNLLRTSPCEAHVACVELAEKHEPCARQLLQPAFAAWFATLSTADRAADRRDVIYTLTKILKDDNLPSEVLQELLNLSEYLERSRGTEYEIWNQHVNNHNGSSPTSSVPSPTSGSSSSASSIASGGLFDINVITERSEHCHLHAKSLHYLEVHIRSLTQQYEQQLDRGRVVPLPRAQWDELLEPRKKHISLCNLLGTERALTALAYLQRHAAALIGLYFELSQRRLLEKAVVGPQLKAYNERRG